MPDLADKAIAWVREREVYAGFLEYADHHIGRVIDALADLGILDDTLVYYIIGDNGASAEGTLQGCFNAAGIVNGPGLETVEYLRERIDQLGGPGAWRRRRWRRAGAGDGHRPGSAGRGRGDRDRERWPASPV
jgi:arylsulfatase